jgi:hypothetical protein
MHSRIGASGPACGYRRSTEPRERILEYALNGASIGLPLPSTETRAIIVQHELQRASRHHIKNYPRWTESQAIQDHVSCDVVRGISSIPGTSCWN